MGDGKSLVNFGDLTKPATILIEKISDAIGGFCKPWQIRRVAQAEADADRIKALSQIETQMEIADLTQRALGRFLAEETKKQDNMESITSRAIPLLEANSKPQEINDDWITNFFDKCRLVSDNEMQILWAKVLAGEANSPGKFSKRTVNFLGSLDKFDAELFANLCGFGWIFGGIGIVPLILDLKSTFYLNHNINYYNLKHLDDIGLLSFNNLASYITTFPSKIGIAVYHKNTIIIEFQKDKDNDLMIGNVLLSKIGQELSSICASKQIPDFLDYVIKYWTNQGLRLFSLLNTSTKPPSYPA